MAAKSWLRAAAGESDEGGRNRSGNPLGQDQLSGSHSCSHLPLSLSLPSSHFLFPLPSVPHPRHFRGKRLLWGSPATSPPPILDTPVSNQRRQRLGREANRGGQQQKSPCPGSKVSHRYSTRSPHPLGQRSAIGIPLGASTSWVKGQHRYFTGRPPNLSSGPEGC